MPFPTNPTLNQIHVSDSRIYTWDGTAWKFSVAAGLGGNGPVVSVAGKTGAVTLTADDVSGAIQYPTYLTDWQTVDRDSSGNGINVAGLAYGNKTFVAVYPRTGVPGAATSPDGVTWTSRTLPPTNVWWSDVTYGSGQFVAVGTRNATGGPFLNVATSPDGITWTLRTTTIVDSSTLDSGFWRGVNYGNGLFIADQKTSYNSAFATSSDGITWTKRTIPAGTWCSVAYGAGLFVSIDGTTGPGFNRALTSPDGVTWTLRTTPNAASWTSVAYGGGKFVAVSSRDYSSFTNAITSTDGTTWTQLSNNIPHYGSAAYSKILYGNGTFVATNNFLTGYVASSPDGTTWTRGGALGAGGGVMAYGNGKFVVGGGSGSRFKLLTTNILKSKYGTEADTICSTNDVRFFDPKSQSATDTVFNHGNSGASKDLDGSAAIQTCTLTANCSIRLPGTQIFRGITVNPSPGVITLVLTQTGSFTATFDRTYSLAWTGGSAPTISTGAGKIDIIRFVSDGGGWHGTIMKNN
jgi:hypothetical protein